MASLSDARFSLPDASVAVHQATAGVDNTLASSIKAFGDIGGEAFKGHLEGSLLNDLQDTGNIINTINAGDDAIRSAVKQGNIDPTSKRFQSLAAATSQGKISQQRATIEAEVLLRESIAKAPGFADEFRKTAREVLGFDPSSASLNSLFLSGPDAAKIGPLTQEQKDLQQADAMFKGGAVESIEQGFKLIQQDRANQLRENIQAGQIADGRVNAGKISVEGANRVTDRLNQVMISAFSQVQNQGGIEDIEAFRGAVLSVRDQVKSKIENEMAASQTHIYSPEEYNQVRSRIDEQAQAYVELLNNQDMTAILAKNRSRLADLVEIAGVQLAPDLAVLAPFGETVVRAYMDMMTIAGDDPVLLEELMRGDPTKAFVGNLVLDAASISASLKGVAEGNLGNLVEQGAVDEETAKAIVLDQANGIAAGKEGGIDMAKVIQGLTEVDMPKTAVSLVSQKPREAFNQMDEKGRAVTVQNFTRTQDQQVSSLQRALANTNGQFTLGFKGGEFVVVDSDGRSLREIDSTAPITFSSEENRVEFTNRTLARSAGVEDALAYVNETLSPIMGDTRWSQLVGFENGNEWAQTLINQVNIGSLAASVGSADNQIVNQLGLREQGRLRAAFQAGDVTRAIEILSSVEGTGVGEAAPASFNTQVDLTGVPQPLNRSGGGFEAPRVGRVHGNPIPSGVQTELEVDLADLEGLHNPEVGTWDGKTVGYGRDLETRPLKPEDYAIIGLEKGASNEEIAIALRDNPEAALKLLQKDIADTEAALVKKAPWVSDLDPVRKDAILGLAYNVGTEGVLGFTEMVKNLQTGIESGDYRAAARELVWNTDKDGNRTPTKWVTQVGEARALATVNMILTGSRA